MPENPVPSKPRNTIDLHMHTHYSDGRASPRELLEHAASSGLTTVAITDHETTLGNREGQQVARELGLELIPAMEISCYWAGYTGHGGGPDIDLLGYFLDLESETLARAEEKLLAGLMARAEIACKHLCAMDYKVTLEDVLETAPTYPGFGPMMSTLERLGVLKAGDSVFGIVEKAVHASDRAAVSIDEAIQIIHDAGGVAVLAHPSIIHHSEDGHLLEGRGMAELVEMGLDGVEVLHYRLNEAQRGHFAALAERFELPISGGSDEHGWPEGFPRMGQEAVTSHMLEVLRERAALEE